MFPYQDVEKIIIKNIQFAKESWSVFLIRGGGPWLDCSFLYFFPGLELLFSFPPVLCTLQTEDDEDAKSTTFTLKDIKSPNVVFAGGLR